MQKTYLKFTRTRICTPTADIAIIGAGTAGLAAFHEISLAGRFALLIDRAPQAQKLRAACRLRTGEKVYSQNCALCHGADGLGQRAGDKQGFPSAVRTKIVQLGRWHAPTG